MIITDFDYQASELDLKIIIKQELRDKITSVCVNVCMRVCVYVCVRAPFYSVNNINNIIFHLIT